MEKSITDLIEFGLRGNRIDNLVQGWTFQVEEVSSNVYKIEGEDELGHHVQSYGIDPVTVLMSCIREAERRTKKKSFLERIKWIFLRR